MKHFLKICEGINVQPLALQLMQNPHLWDQNQARKEACGSPHKAMSDIWIRYNDPARIHTKFFHTEHFPVWYPASSELPSIKPISLSLMAKMGATHLGGILITKIPPGGRILPHVDDNWHANFYNCKLYIPIQTNPYVVNRCENERVVMNTGECWYFNNHVEHDVINNGTDDRITLIICMKTDD